MFTTHMLEMACFKSEPEIYTYRCIDQSPQISSSKGFFKDPSKGKASRPSERLSAGEATGLADTPTPMKLSANHRGPDVVKTRMKTLLGLEKWPCQPEWEKNA